MIIQFIEKIYTRRSELRSVKIYMKHLNVVTLLRNSKVVLQVSIDDIIKYRVRDGYHFFATIDDLLFMVLET